MSKVKPYPKGIARPIKSRAAQVSETAGPSGGRSRYGIAPLFVNQSPPSGTETVAYSYTFTATGQPAPTFAVASGALPTGLTLDATTGVLGGTPSAAATYNFTVSITNSFGVVTSATKTVIIA